MNSLPPLEKRIYDYIKKAISENGYSPSIRDIKNELAIKSTSTVHLHLKHLEEHGYIYKDDGKSRAIRIDITPGELKNKIPILGDIRKGSPLDADENFDGYFHFSVPAKYKEKKLFAIRLNGKIPRPEGFCDSDILIVSKEEAISEGDMIVTFKSESVSVQKHQSIDALSEGFNFNDCEILGKVIASVRFY